MKLPGRITIARLQGYGEGIIKIEIEDGESSLRIMEVSLGLANFTEVLTGKASVSCELDYNNDPAIGKARQNKTELVLIPEGMSPSPSNKESRYELLTPYEVNGWKGRKEDLDNFHNRVSKKGKEYYRVVFVRYV
jgi:hypothetical protein